MGSDRPALGHPEAAALWQRFVTGEIDADRRPVEIARSRRRATRCSTAAGRIGGRGSSSRRSRRRSFRGDQPRRHSMKDVPAEQPRGLAIVCITKREDPRDVFLSEARPFEALRRVAGGTARCDAGPSSGRAPRPRHPDLRGPSTPDPKGGGALRRDRAGRGGVRASGGAKIRHTTRDLSLPAFGPGGLGSGARGRRGRPRGVSFLEDRDTRCASARSGLPRPARASCQCRSRRTPYGRGGIALSG